MKQGNIVQHIARAQDNDYKTTNYKRSISTIYIQ